MRLVIGILCLLAATDGALAQTVNSGNNNGGGNLGTANGNGNGNTGNLSGNLSGNAVLQTSITKNRNTPSVSPPGLAAAGIESCLGSTSGGISGSGFGISVGGSYTDKPCNLRLYARTLYAMGHRVAATQILCNDPDVAQALAVEGVQCFSPVSGAQGSNGLTSASASPNVHVCKNYDVFSGCRD